MDPALGVNLDRKSTRLNSSHRCISYAVFCLKKKRASERLGCLLTVPCPQHWSRGWQACWGFLRSRARPLGGRRSWVCGGLFFFFNDTATTEIYTLSLHDALPI